MKTLALLLLVCAIPMSIFAGVRINGIGFTYPTIQEAVDAATSGDRLHVSTGEYAEIVLITNNNIIVEGGYLLDYITKTNDPSTTIVNGGGGPGSVFSLSNSTVTFEYLNICSGAVWGAGGGIQLSPMCTVTTRQCRIYGNAAFLGGGIYAPSNTILVVTNTFINNNFAIAGGGISGENYCHVVMEGPSCQCYGNFASVGAGVSILNGNLIVQGGADVFANIANSYGGGIYLAGGATGVIQGFGTGIGHSVLAGNGATNDLQGWGGGIYVKDSTLTVAGSGCVVMGNNARNGGGGVYLTNSTLTVKNGGSIGYPDFWFANFTDGVGGGIYALDSTVIVTNNSTVIYGIAGAGGGIYSFRSDINFYGATLGATNLGASSIADAGGGLFAVFSQLQFHNSRIIDNFANAVGGGMYLVFSNDLLAVNTEISGNTAISGGGGAIFADSFFGSCVLDNTRVISNISHYSAGGIYWHSIDTLTAHNGTEINYNFASNNFGGVWLSVPGTLSFRDTDISHNTAVNGIGGMGSTGGGHINCIDCNMNYNNGVGLTLDYPGGLYLYKSSASLIAENRDCEIMRNTGIYGGGIGLEKSSILEIIAPTSNTYTIGNNHSIYHGGGLFCKEDSVVSIYGNVIFNENTGVIGGGLCASNDCEMTLEPTNTFAPIVSANNARMHGGGVATLYDTIFDAINCEFIDNTASNFGGGVFAFNNANINIDSDFSGPDNSILPRSKFVNNSTLAGWGGGIMMVGVSNSTIANTLFASNATLSAGSAIASMLSYVSIDNVIAVNNESPYSAVLLSGNPDISLYNCTIADNGLTGVVSILPGAAFPDMQNCIVWGHSTLQVSTNMDVQFSDIQGGYPGPFNITNDPMFADSGLLDYQLLAGSECIDKGATLVSVTNDCIGNPRPYDGGWDIGAYEYIPEPCLFIIYYLSFIIFRKFKSKI